MRHYILHVILVKLHLNDWPSSQRVWLLTKRLQVSFPALPQFEKWIRSGMESSLSHEENLVAT